MNLIKLPLEEIIPYENNPRNNDDAVYGVMESIKQCSYVQPIIVDENHVILAGHTRLKALTNLGYKEAECIVYEGLTEEQKKKFRYLDNKTGEAAEWDLRKLSEELEELDFGELDFFNLQLDDFSVDLNYRDKVGAWEYDPEAFGDEQFDYECPQCGFHFSRT